MNPTILASYRFFRGRTGCVGRDAVAALSLARAEYNGKRRGLVVVWEDDPEEYMMGDAETERPAYVLVGLVYRAADIDRHGTPRRRAVPLACVGGVGVNDSNDPYLRHLGAELLSEALDELDDEDQAAADVLAARATYAGIGG